MEIGYLSSASFNIALIVQWLYCAECLEIKHVSPQWVGDVFRRFYTFAVGRFAFGTGPQTGFLVALLHRSRQTSAKRRLAILKKRLKPLF